MTLAWRGWVGGWLRWIEEMGLEWVGGWVRNSSMIQPPTHPPTYLPIPPRRVEPSCDTLHLSSLDHASSECLSRRAYRWVGGWVGGWVDGLIGR